MQGKALRDQTPREGHAKWKAANDRPDPLELLELSNAGREKDLVPLRMGRMAASPFAFLRGSACVMAWDLAQTPVSGIKVILDGDAHLNNFGLYGTPQRDIVFDLNDFDEATPGPWEWDLKRLTASVNVAARENGLNRAERAAAVMRCVDGYRFNLNRLQSMGILDVWYLHAYPGRQNPLVKADAKSRAVFKKALATAATQTNQTLLAKTAVRAVNGSWKLLQSPPVLTPVSDDIREKVIDGLNAYSDSLNRERRYMLSRYHVVDVVHRVVGVGSVGTRCYLALLMGNSDEDALFLQVKEAGVAAFAPYVPRLAAEFSHQGKRIVMGQRALQASSDVMLGWTEIDKRPYYVRQMKNMKASIPVEWLTGSSFSFYAWACGAILARAHARTGDAALLAGYCGNTPVLDKALARISHQRLHS
ncbi:MAG TPA: DUF2252 domain-containing protein [Bryobacteraceae bacterium]|nr:DUF2252 domain-containing protein [Bryobacteraceae bacterium]